MAGSSSNIQPSFFGGGGTDNGGLGVTSSGQYYGGYGSGSFMDYLHRVVYETDQYNPIALVWDGIKGNITGSDRFGNELSGFDSNLKIASAVPITKVGSILTTTTERIIFSEVKMVTRTSTDFVSDVTATSFGKIWGQGTVNVGKTINAIRTGSLKPAGVYNNLERHVQLLGKPNGYWQKYELLDYGSKAPLRIIKGGNGELFLTPDHYKSLIPLGGL